jgi:hypothetical protein
MAHGREGTIYNKSLLGSLLYRCGTATFGKRIAGKHTDGSTLDPVTRPL